jgi:hypothetical protein
MYTRAMAQDDPAPHLVLYWTMDCPAQRLWIQIAPDLTYDAINGGKDGYIKNYQGVTTNITADEWDQNEKYWISENYGDQYGYFRKCSIVTKHPEGGWDQGCPNGLGRDGEYLDHMQRSQYVLEAHDVATICPGPKGDLYQTPDNGKTVFVRKGTRNVFYSAELMSDPNSYWPDWPQACLMQPYTKSYKLSSYDELLAAGCSTADVDKCRAGQWDAPRRPELQKYYVYPIA